MKTYSNMCEEVFNEQSFQRLRKSVFRNSGPPASGGKLNTYSNTRGKVFPQQSFIGRANLFSEILGHLLRERGWAHTATRAGLFANNLCIGRENRCSEILGHLLRVRELMHLAIRAGRFFMISLVGHKSVFRNSGSPASGEESELCGFAHSLFVFSVLHIQWSWYAIAECGVRLGWEIWLRTLLFLVRAFVEHCLSVSFANFEDSGEIGWDRDLSHEHCIGRAACHLSLSFRLLELIFPLTFAVVVRRKLCV